MKKFYGFESISELITAYRYTYIHKQRISKNKDS